MKHILLFKFLITTLFLLNNLKVSAQKADTIPSIAILGTMHFANTNDYAEIQIEDLMEDHRQKELISLVDKIAAYKPTKIMIEWEPSESETTNQELANYFSGEFELGRNEVYQIGFRLAKKMKITQVVPVDFQMSLGDQEVMNYLNDEGKTEQFTSVINQVVKWAQNETEKLKSMSLTAYYQYLNSNSYDVFNRNFYLQKLMTVSDKPDTPIVNYVANWYKRNLNIMKNIDSNTSSQDRVLVIVGAGHRAILKGFYESRSDVRYEEIGEFLSHP
ncbi:MAG: DUF5694 domain-containing protein [Fulvivirga sp.]|uniref:DUF5694 domain-containing protein n=1 Tax=Fulvivirga sp. TaxID=1931237 RepID=UPI0032EBA15A